MSHRRVHLVRGLGRASPRGFTLIELLVTISIVAILAVVAVPSFNEAILGNKLTSFANNFVASANLSRSEAIKRNGIVTLCRSASGTGCATSGGWQQGWIVFSDTNKNGSVDMGETVIQYQQALSSDYLLTGDTYSISFQPIGGGVTPATLKLCRASSIAVEQKREIAISAMGRTTVKKTTTGVCT
jgi:type IV fimbrial biogenesis protein FimT